MGGQLHHLLRRLCFNTGWKYAVFWKLQHRSRMMFTWEDAYYHSSQCQDNKCSDETAGSSNDGPYAHDPLASALAKMSYQVYSLGEGIIGQLAVSGKHSWIFSDQHADDSSSMPEYFCGWRNQFSAGIKTIAVVAVIPHGVVQLGSLHRISEDVKLVDYIRNVFSELQDPLASCFPSSTRSNTANSCWSDACSVQISTSASFQDCLAGLERSSDEDEVNLWSPLFSPASSIGSHSHMSSPLGGYLNRTLKTKMHDRECSMQEHGISLSSSSENFLTSQPSQVDTEMLCDTKFGAQMKDLRSSGKGPRILSTASVISLDTSIPHAGSLIVTDRPLEILDSPACRNQGKFHVSELPSMQLHQDFGKLELPIKSNQVEPQISPFSFCAGYELYEALGPSFQKEYICAWEAEKATSNVAIEVSEGIGSSSLLRENSDMHLLDAVVARVSHKGGGAESEISFRETGESFLTSEKMPCKSLGTIKSASYPSDRDTSCSFNSVAGDVESLKGFSSTSCSGRIEHSERQEFKMNKKRSRPCGSGRPRPRDRQLIQDRIKELRELVPNGSKCSIDSLLERAIKHMIFMQSVCKYAEKLKKCSASNLLDKDTCVQRFSSREQGSSWAVEVGDNQNVCPIIVENINMNGQMLVEMVCEECSHFLDIAETIRSLGLTILKGVSGAYGKKTWMCFVVEGQDNRSMHRIDVLWSLMQLMQPRTTS